VGLLNTWLMSKVSSIIYMKTCVGTIILCSVIISGCCQRTTAYGFVNVKKINAERYKYEIEIPYHFEGRGNIHAPFDLSKYEQETAVWIYINKTNGKIDANDLALTDYKGKVDYPWPQTDLRGYLEFTGDILILNFQVPYYKETETPDHWEPYKFNGKYKVGRISNQ
jgi:hypothetical protein